MNSESKGLNPYQMKRPLYLLLGCTFFHCVLSIIRALRKQKCLPAFLGSAVENGSSCHFRKDEESINNAFTQNCEKELYVLERYSELLFNLPSSARGLSTCIMATLRLFAIAVG